MRVSIASDHIGTGTLWRAPSRKTRHRQIETSPEEMYGTHLAEKSSTKFLEERVAVGQNPPKAMRVLGIVRCVLRVLFEWNWIGNLYRRRPDIHVDTHGAQRLHDFGIKLGHRLWCQRQFPV